MLCAQVLDTLAEINERHEAVKELEKGLQEVYQIFLDMAVLVEAQGEMLDNIEQQVGGSVSTSVGRPGHNVLGTALPSCNLPVLFPVKIY